ncbi:MAG: chemotaxis response regulator protein-glutamate methylesterase [Myxococcales bacterium]|nr:chemotaxis response regulator protein-glutamate methylesterase [Myxococcales bacterium]
MLKKGRILVVDDSTIARTTIEKIVTAEDDLEVVGKARDGRQALELADRVAPDIVTLDVEMPHLSGLETLKLLAARHPRVKVIMFSAHTEKGAAITMDCLLAGAADYIAKPSNMANREAAVDYIRDQLVPRIRALLKEKASPKTAPALMRTPPPSLRRPNAAPLSLRKPNVVVEPAPQAVVAPAESTGIELLCIGSSTGGPDALARVLTTLRRPLPVPALITQHMPPTFTKALADRLSARTGHRVREAKGGELLEPGDIWVAPGDYHMVIEPRGPRLAIRLHQEAPENSCRPAVDTMLRSVAATVGAGALTVILTGMGSDGAIGCRLLRDKGARVIAQDEASSVVWGMPGAVTNAGLANQVLPVGRIGAAINEILASNRGAKLRMGAA